MVPPFKFFGGSYAKKFWLSRIVGIMEMVS